MIVVFCDGLCEPVNPGGTACYGWVAYEDKSKLSEECGVVCSGPGATNNVAEYTAVIKALKWLLDNGFSKEAVEVRSDSQLCIYQLSGKYSVRSSRIIPLYRRAVSLAGRFQKIRFRWVPREENEEADALSRKAYRQHALLDSERLKKAEKLAPFVRPLGGEVFVVPSQSGNGEYRVSLADLSCTCADFQKHGMNCKHILAVQMAVGQGESFKNVPRLQE